MLLTRTLKNSLDAPNRRSRLVITDGAAFVILGFCGIMWAWDFTLIFGFGKTAPRIMRGRGQDGGRLFLMSAFILQKIVLGL